MNKDVVRFLRDAGMNPDQVIRSEYGSIGMAGRFPPEAERFYGLEPGSYRVTGVHLDEKTRTCTKTLNTGRKITYRVPDSCWDFIWGAAMARAAGEARSAKPKTSQ